MLPATTALGYAPVPPWTAPIECRCEPTAMLQPGCQATALAGGGDLSLRGYSQLADHVQESSGAPLPHVRRGGEGRRQWLGWKSGSGARVEIVVNLARHGPADSRRALQIL